jgi:AcrR family transcriptional regulator
MVGSRVRLGDVRDATATRSRIMAAAAAEFAEHGIAGARIDRIAAAARANKAQIYAYIGTKDALFDAVFGVHVASNVNAVPFAPRDLPGYAVQLYDAYLADPTLVRLLAWRRLERTPTGDLFAHLPHHADEVHAALLDAQRDGVVVDDLAPEDIWPMLIALAGTWAQAAIVHTADPAEPLKVHQRRRRVLRTTVRRAFCVPS